MDIKAYLSDKRVIVCIIILVILIMTFFFVVQCDREEEQEEETLPTTVKTPQKRELPEPTQKTFCGDDVCEAEEVDSCPTDCPVACTDNDDCSGGKECSPKGICIPARDVLEETEQFLYERIDSLEEHATQVLDSITDVQNFLEYRKSQMSDEDYEELEDEVDEFYDETESNIIGITDATNMLTGDITDLTTVTIKDFFTELLELRETYREIREDVGKNRAVFFAQINKAAGIEGPDLVISNVVFETFDNTYDGTFSITIKNIGNEDIDDSFETTVRLSVDHDSVDTCTEQIDELNDLVEEKIECTFALGSYYERLEKEEEAGIDVQLDIEVDADEEIKELNEDNNDFIWDDEWTLKFFQS